MGNNKFFIGGCVKFYGSMTVATYNEVLKDEWLKTYAPLYQNKASCWEETKEGMVGTIIAVGAHVFDENSPVYLVRVEDGRYFIMNEEGLKKA